MTPAQHARLDEATVAMLAETSYSGCPRDVLADCPVCGRPFWTGAEGARRYCSRSCIDRRWYLDNRARKLARVAAYDRQRRERVA